MTDLYDYHNGPNLGLEPTTPGQVRGADVAQPKRSPYNASGSLSEYGIFPECDATPAAQASGQPADDFDDSDIPFIRNDGRS